MKNQLECGTYVWGQVDPGAVTQIENTAKEAAHTALMADHHKGYNVPIGGVAAYRDAISPSGVGFDIACGNKAVQLDVDINDIRKDMSKIMDEVVNRISFGVGRANNEPVEDSLIEDHMTWYSLPWLSGRPNSYYSDYKTMAMAQLGTVGSGNHYVDIFHDDDGNVWIGVHFGSRGLGHKIASYYLELGNALPGMDDPPCVISTETGLGQEYLEAMALAGDYAYAGRDWVCQKVADIIGASIVDQVHNHHNYAWLEPHFGEMLWVVRKGATPAFPGQRGFVGSSMAEPSVILVGKEPTEEAEKALYSTVHGAGRVMGRREAKGKVHRKTGEVIRPGKVSRASMDEAVMGANVVLRGGDVDEAPACYKRLSDVLEAHKNTVEVERYLYPVGVAMAGDGVVDPYKD